MGTTGYANLERQKSYPIETLRLPLGSDRKGGTPIPAIRTAVIEPLESTPKPPFPSATDRRHR